MKTIRMGNNFITFWSFKKAAPQATRGFRFFFF